jgi:predicted CxxxxCH...CXXCH cytochrome family protein
MRIERLSRLGVILAAALVAACGSERSVADANLGVSCVNCHGGLDNDTGAPPTDSKGSATGPAVGAHTVHVQAGVSCDSCHAVPDRFGAPGHPNGVADVTFGGLAAAGTVEDRTRTGPPQYAAATQTCSSVYCHGGTLDAGGTATAPSWGQTLTACGTCHSFPPPSHAIYLNQGLTCSQCHALSVEADNFTLKPAHLDGTLNFNFF